MSQWALAIDGELQQKRFGMFGGFGKFARVIMHLYEVLKRPITTEKSNRLKDENRHYAFEVDLRANKLQVRQAVEKAFPNIEVVSVNIIRMPRKRRRFGRRILYTPVWKKAIVTIPASQRIDLFEGV